jgi:hypothetical protein
MTYEQREQLSPGEEKVWHELLAKRGIEVVFVRGQPPKVRRCVRPMWSETVWNGPARYPGVFAPVRAPDLICSYCGATPYTF